MGAPSKGFSWTTFSSGCPEIVLLLVIGAVFLFISKLIVEKAVTSRMDLAAERITRELERRSSFEERILTDRYEAFRDLFAALQRVSTDMNRVWKGREVQGFSIDGDVVALTEIFDRLAIDRLVLGEMLFARMDAAARLLLSLVAQRPADPAHRDALGRKWLDEMVRLRHSANEEFHMTQVAWDR